MPNNDAFIKLREMLAHVYYDTSRARRVVGDAGLAEQAITFSGAMIDTWDFILKQAENENKMGALFRVISITYGPTTEIYKAFVAYRPEVVQIHTPDSGRSRNGGILPRGVTRALDGEENRSRPGQARESASESYISSPSERYSPSPGGRYPSEFGMSPSSLPSPKKSKLHQLMARARKDIEQLDTLDDLVEMIGRLSTAQLPTLMRELESFISCINKYKNGGEIDDYKEGLETVSDAVQDPLTYSFTREWPRTFRGLDAVRRDSISQLVEVLSECKRRMEKHRYLIGEQEQGLHQRHEKYVDLPEANRRTIDELYDASGEFHREIHRLKIGIEYRQVHLRQALTQTIKILRHDVDELSSVASQ